MAKTQATSTPTDINIKISDVTTNNVSTSAHGFAPKAPNDATKFLNGAGLYTTPTGITLGQALALQKGFAKP